MRRNIALNHASSGEDFLDSREKKKTKKKKQIIKTLLGKTLRTSLWTASSRRSGDTLEEKGQEALHNYFDMRQSKAEAIQDNINREEMMSLSLQNSTKIALDEKVRGNWLMYTSASSEQEIACIRIVTERSTGLYAVKRTILQTIVSRWREEVRDDRREQEDRAHDTTGTA